MRILILGDGGSSHIQKWVAGLLSKKFEIGLFSFHHFDPSHYPRDSAFAVLSNPAGRKAGSIWSKAGYFFYVGALKKALKKYNPNILHAHYASSYGLIGMLTGFQPFIISVWGADIYDFPQISPIHKFILKKTLSGAGYICSTSHCMKSETLLYTQKGIDVIPFGVGAEFLSVENGEESVIGDAKIRIIGTIKSLEDKYGIDFLIKAFAVVKKELKDCELRLLIVGDGSKKKALKELATKLGISQHVDFKGRVAHHEIAKMHRQIDVFVGLSVLDSESFGVSLVEAMACGKAVIVSDVEGYKEVLGDPPAGLIVSRKNSTQAAQAISQLIRNPELAKTLGESAARRVSENYRWDQSLDLMEGVYRNIRDQKK